MNFHAHLTDTLTRPKWLTLMEQNAPQKIVSVNKVNTVCYGKESIKFNSTKSCNYLQNTLNINLLEISRAKAIKLISKHFIETYKDTWSLSEIIIIILLLHTHIHTYIYTHAYIFIYIYIYIYIYVCMYVCMYVCV